MWQPPALSRAEWALGCVCVLSMEGPIRTLSKTLAGGARKGRALLMDRIA